MARRYRSDNRVAEGIAGLIMLAVFFLAWFSLTDKINPGLWILWGGMLISAVGIVLILWSELQAKSRKNLLAAVRQAGAEEDINNFINSFGHEKKFEKNLWSYEGYTFTWSQLDSLRRALQAKGVQLSDSHYKDIGFLLRHYIYHKEDAFVRESIAHQNHTFASLNPSQFEDLLRRLYEAMGYSVMRTGRTGDMGSDLVVNMADQRAVVQAKHYTGSVSPAAVQQAVGALKAYDCTKAYVVTNSSFTPEAMQLAKINNVGLVDGHRLREMLLQNLGENWG